MLISYIIMVFVSEYVDCVGITETFGMQKKVFHRKCILFFVHVVFNYYPETLMLVSSY